ncbi:MAG TPA: hypothetical protein VJB59_14945 [Bdellovibrionota bacterium]|nr:hypothetical protein [Bdellovibrionota bacterium]
MNKKMNTEINKVINRVKAAQVKFEELLKNQDWVEEVRTYAERQRKEVQSLLTSDVSMVRKFIERERKELEKFQNQIPGEVEKLRGFVKAQKKELEKLLGRVRKTATQGTKTKRPKSRKPGKKAASTKKSAGT